MIESTVKSIMDVISISTCPTRINNTYQSNKPFSSIIKNKGHFCIGNYMFGNYHDDKSICVANMIGHSSGGFFEDNEWYNLVPQLIISEDEIWSPAIGTLPICNTEEKHFQELTRTDLKGFEVEDFENILFFYEIVKSWIKYNSKINS